MYEKGNKKREKKKEKEAQMKHKRKTEVKKDKIDTRVGKIKATNMQKE
jgi:hypothetical protein